MSMSNPKDGGRPPPDPMRGRNGAGKCSHNPYETSAQGGKVLS